MTDLLEFRVSKLTLMSCHFRQLADSYLAPAVSAKIIEVADEYDEEVVRIERECRGKRLCPCEFSSCCISYSVISFH
jgi:hypothetical protein